jgi:hypothetical protein
VAVTYYLAPSLVQLRDEVNERWPKRDKSSDGWIGDTSHQARPSDHNPDYSSGGVVRAIDVDDSGVDRVALLNEVIGDPRVWYVISHGKIYSVTHGWAANAYTGSNSHHEHMHISIRHTKGAETNTAKWFGHKRRTKLPDVDVDQVIEQFKNGGRRDLRGVRMIQRALNALAGADLVVDGHAGAKTRAAYAAWERATGSRNQDGIPGPESLTRLGRQRFRVISP